MKIVLVMPSWSYRGGERIFLNLAGALGEKNEVVVISGRKEKMACKLLGNLKLRYPKRFNFLLLNNLFFVLFAWLFIFWDISKEIKRANWIITESNNCLIASFLASVIFNKKLAWYVLAYETRHYDNKLLNFLWEITFGVVEKICISKVEVIFSLSDRVEGIILRRFGRKSTILNPLVSDRYFVSKDKRNNKIRSYFKNSKVLFLPAAFHPKKNQKLAIYMLNRLKKKHKDLKLVLAGSGKDEKYLKSLVQKLSLEESVFFPGVIKGENLRFCYRKSFLTLVCSYNENEGLSLTALESLLFKTPVLVSSEAGVASFIKNNQFGLVASPNIDNYIDGFNRIYNSYPKYRQMAKTASKYIKLNFNKDYVANTIISKLKYY